MSAARSASQKGGSSRLGQRPHGPITFFGNVLIDVLIWSSSCVTSFALVTDADEFGKHVRCPRSSCIRFHSELLPSVDRLGSSQSGLAFVRRFVQPEGFLHQVLDPKKVHLCELEVNAPMHSLDKNGLEHKGR